MESSVPAITEDTYEPPFLPEKTATLRQQVHSFGPFSKVPPPSTTPTNLGERFLCEPSLAKHLGCPRPEGDADDRGSQERLRLSFI